MNLDEQLDKIDYQIQTTTYKDPMGYPDGTFLSYTRLRLTDHAKDTIKALIAEQVKQARLDELEKLLPLNKKLYGQDADLAIKINNRLAQQTKQEEQ